MSDQGKTERQPRGQARRKALIEAVIRLLAREGAAGVTHRAVAKEAGAKHGSARYYFSTRGEMLQEALNAIVLDQASEVANLIEAHGDKSDAALVDALATHLNDRILNHREGELARYELFLAAARSGEYQATLNAWANAYIGLFESRAATRGAELSQADGWRTLNLLNGLILQQLAAPSEGFQQQVLVPTLKELLASTH